MTANQIDKMIGKGFNHSNIGKVRVIEKIERSRTKVLVKEIDRGPGWNPEKEKYTGVSSKTYRDGTLSSTSWCRGQNYDLGEKHQVRIDYLTPIL